jgi:hypothetical protein
MPYTVKNWCIHPSHDVIDPITGKNVFVKSGQKPTHPIGIHRISAFMANAINQEYSLFSDRTSKKVFEGDKICTNCLRTVSQSEFTNGIYADNTDEDLPSSQEQKHTQEETKRKLNIIFDSLNIPTIRDLYV